LKIFNAKSSGIESRAIFLSMDDAVREEIREEMTEKQSTFLEALKTDNVTILPRLIGFAKKLKCKRCPHVDGCWGLDGETVEAMKSAGELSIIERIPEVYA
jgi:hypothetical protein